MEYARYISLGVAVVSFIVSGGALMLGLHYRHKARKLQALLDDLKAPQRQPMGETK